MSMTGCALLKKGDYTIEHDDRANNQNTVGFETVDKNS